MRLSRLVMILVVVSTAGARAQATGTGSTPRPAAPSGRSITRSAPTMVSFFSGAWRCTAVFPNGRTFGQTMEFHSVLGGAWLSAAQDDAEPGTYHALAMWGVSPTNGIVAEIADSQGGMRRFIAADGWAGDKLALVRDTVYANIGRYAERFTYERQTDSTFRMTYETMRDTVSWREGDHVLCGRSRG